MVGSKLTLKAIFKAKKAKNRTSLEHPYFGCSNEVEILAVLTKLKIENCNSDHCNVALIIASLQCCIDHCNNVAVITVSLQKCCSDHCITAMLQ